MADYWESIANSLGKAQAPEMGQAETGLYSFIHGLGPALIGLNPPPALQKGMEKYPGTAIASEIAGMLVPYAGWAKIAKGIPRFGQMLESIGSAEKLAQAPFTTRAIQEIATFAPFEIGRTLAGAAVGETLGKVYGGGYEGTTDLMKEAAINLGFAGVAGGAIETIFKSPVGAALPRRTIPGANMLDPYQLQIRQGLEMLPKVTDPVQVPQLQSAIAGLGWNVRSAELADVKAGRKLKGAKNEPVYVDELISEKGAGKAQEINRWFNVNTSNKAQINSNLLVYGSSKGVGTKTDLQSVMGQAGPGFDFGWEGFVEHPRMLTAKTDQAASNLRSSFTRSMDLVDSKGTLSFVSQMPDNNFFVMARKIAGEAEPKAGDRWLLWKTDQPGKFLPEHQKFGAMIADKAKFLQEPDLGVMGVESWDKSIAMRDEQLIDYTGLVQNKGSVGKAAQYVLKKAGLDQAQNTEAARRLSRFFSDYIKPAMFQFGDNPLALRLQGIIRASRASAEGRADIRFHGAGAYASPAKVVFAGAKPEVTKGSIYDFIYKQITDKDLEDIAKIRMLELSPDQARAELGISDNLHKFLTTLNKVDAEIDAPTLKLQEGLKAAGIKLQRPYQPRPNHYMIPHTFEGNWRVQVVDENGKLAAFGAGNGPKSTILSANNLVEKAAERGAAWRVKERTLGTYEGQMSDELQLKMMRNPQYKLLQQIYHDETSKMVTPGRFKQRGGIEGYKNTFTRNELAESIYRTMRSKELYQNDLFIDYGLKNLRDRLQVLDPATAIRLEKRISQIRGQQGEISKAINQSADKVLAPVLGTNSASKIVATANETMFHLGLGFGNLGYAVANMFTFLQTALPHVAYLMSADPARVSAMYTFLPVVSGRRVSTIASLDVMKAAYHSFKALAKPDAELTEMLGRAQRESAITPKFVEEFTGQTATRLMGVRESAGDFVKFLKAVSNLVPGFTEQFARGHSFTLGYVVGKEAMNLQGEQLYRFAREFTEKTQFLYSAADRPVLLTGPLGAAFGLFKTWMIHYIGFMMEYAGEGFMRGNWTPFLWMMGGTGLVGGLGAIPGYTAFDAVSKALSNKSLILNTYEQFGEMADPAFYGVPGLMGFSIQNQVSAPGQDMMRDIQFLSSFAYWDRLKVLANVGGGLMDAMEMGTHPAKMRQFTDGLARVFAPKAIYRAASLDFQDGSVKSLTTGYPVTSGLSAPEMISYMFGINPLEVEKTYQIHAELFANQDAKRAAVERYGRLYAEAMGEQDTRMASDVMKRAMLEGINVSSVAKSAMSRMAKARKDMLQRQFEPQALLPYVRAMKDQ